MRKTLQHSITFFLAIFYLLTSFGFSLNTHVCQGEIQASSLWLQAEKCNMPRIKTACEKHETCNLSGFEKEDCCEDESQILSVPSFFLGKISKVEFVSATFFTITPRVLLPEISEGISFVFDTRYPPPLLQKNATEAVAKLQTFLC